MTQLRFILRTLIFQPIGGENTFEAILKDLTSSLFFIQCNLAGTLLAYIFPINAGPIVVYPKHTDEAGYTTVMYFLLL